jgi:signal transduction histidine kinase/CheY-like chemotaxis protein
MNTFASSSHKHARPLRMRLLMLAASGLLPLIIVLAWGIDHLFQERREEAQRSSLALSRALATAVQSELRATMALLNHMGYSEELETADLRGFYLEAIRTSEQLGWRQITLADGEGRLLMRTNETYGAPLSAPAEPASMARVVETLQPAVTPVLATPNHVADAFAVRMPVVRSGKLVYVITAVIPTQIIASVLGRQVIPPDTLVWVFDQASYRVARSREVETRRPSASLQALLDRGELQGVGRTVSGEGIDNYTGYTRLPGSGWVVVVGTSVESVNAGLLPLLRALALGLTASLTLAALLAWVLAREVVEPIDALKAGAAALGHGDPVELPALDIVELDDVAIALKDAAAERDKLSTQAADALRMAEEANRSKDQFLAMLGHELRNPLAPILNAIQIMARKGDGSTAHERQIIERQLVHVTRLVDDLLDVSRITGKRLTIHKQPVRIGQLLGEVVDTIRPSLHNRGLALALGPGMEHAWVAGDEVRLVQVFNNLLVNAIKFTPSGGSIRIEAQMEEGAVRIDVGDNGIGISRDELHRVFDLFYQAPQSSDRAQGGLGLGLPIVRSLVEMHDGTVEAASAGAGQGTCFTVRLPLCEAPVPQAPPPPAPTPQGTGRVLVVDDNEDAADTCATLLDMNGYTVRVAYTPKAALDALSEFTPDLAILDIGLPGMSGYELARLMKAEPANYSGHLVALTGYGQATDRAASKRAGFEAHLTKPVSPSDLLELVSRMARGA